MKMTEQKLRDRTGASKNINTAIYLQIDVDKAARVIVDSYSGKLDVNNILLQTTTNENAVIELKDDEAEVWQQVEIRLSNNNFPIARCDCAKGNEQIHCEHLIKALFAFAILGESGLVNRITKNSSSQYIPLKRQAA